MMVGVARTVTSRLLIVVAAAIVPQAILAALLMTRYAHNQHSDYGAQVTTIARGIAAAADGEISVLFATARALARSDSLRRGDLAPFLEQARAVAERAGGAWHIALIDEHGDQVLNTERPLGALMPPASREIIREALRTGRPEVTPVVRCAIDNSWVVGVAVPVEQAALSGKLFLAVMAEPGSLQTRLPLEHLPPRSSVTVIDRAGDVVARIGVPPDAAAGTPAGTPAGTAADTPAGTPAGVPIATLDPHVGWPAAADLLLPLGDAADSQTVTHLPDGTAMLTAFARAPLSGWMVAIRVPEAAALAPLHHSLILIGGCGLALSLLALALALYHARGIGRSVEVLSDAAAALERRTVPPRIDVSLAVVQAAHDRIRAAAARLIAQDRERSGLLAELEDRVAARTRELAISEQRYRLLAETATDLILRTDGAGTFRYVSPAAETLALERPEALLGRRLRDLALVTDLPQVAAFEHAVLAGNTTVRCTFRLRPRDGCVIWVEAAGHRISDEPDALDGAVIALRDISERKAAEERVARAAADARAADRAKSEFLARMSHELRTPLNAVNGFAEVLLQDPAISPVHRDWVGHIVSGARQLLRLIEDVLDLARIESGRLKVVLAGVDAAALIEEAVRMLAPAAAERPVTLTAAPVPAGTTVLADRARLLQVLLNLGSNAIKYNRPGGQVSITVSRLPGEPGAEPRRALWGEVAGPSAGEQDAEKIRFTVADDGPGIPAGRAASIFQPLQRLGEAHSRADGTGIGLAITRQLVGLMRGVITVESAPGQGATFHVDLPAGEAAAAGMGAAHPQPGWAGGGPFTVLYIEDTEAAVQLMRAIFAFVPGARLRTVGTAEDGIRVARETRPDCVITDIRLPGLDGFEVLAALRNDPLTADLPVIALSGEAMPEAVAIGRSAGFFAYITKPFQLTTLIDTLDEVRRQRAAAVPLVALPKPDTAPEIRPDDGDPEDVAA